MRPKYQKAAKLITEISKIVVLPEYYNADITTKHSILVSKIDNVAIANSRKIFVVGGHIYVGTPLLLTSGGVYFSFYKKHIKVVRNHVTERYTYDILPILFMNMMGW